MLLIFIELTATSTACMPRNNCRATEWQLLHWFTVTVTELNADSDDNTNRNRAKNFVTKKHCISRPKIYSLEAYWTRGHNWVTVRVGWAASHQCCRRVLRLQSASRQFICRQRNYCHNFQIIGSLGRSQMVF